MQARDVILSAWRADVDRYIGRSQGVSRLPPAVAAYGDIAWTFLDTYGFINFGLAPDILAARSPQSTAPGTVIVLGAGLAGLAAARQLVKFGHTVLICEAKGRAGGRVQTVRLEVRSPDLYLQAKERSTSQSSKAVCARAGHASKHRGSQTQALSHVPPTARVASFVRVSAAQAITVIAGRTADIIGAALYYAQAGHAQPGRRLCLVPKSK
jgi:hypothetical protein